MPEFEIIEELAVFSEISNAIIKVRLRRLLNHEPSKFSHGPYCLDLKVGGILHQHYGIDEPQIREIAIRFLLKHVDGLAPALH